ncbi:MAG: hypothetical protein V9E98_03740 [Candidatus Nanopelagicales bacterium]
MVGRKLADKFGWKIGDQIPLRGTIYPGTWTFTLRGIYDGADAKHRRAADAVPLGTTSTRSMRQRCGHARATSVGVYVVGHPRARRRGS